MNIVKFLENDEDNDEKNEERKIYPFLEKNLFNSRNVLIFGEISMNLAHRVTAELITLSHNSNKPINIIINSPGGHVESGDTIYDLMRFIDVPVNVIGTGWVASAGALIFLGAKKERRFSLPNTRFLLHQPSGSVRGKALDIDIHAKEIIRTRERINRIIAVETNTPIEKVRKDTERDYWLSSEEAKEYGLVGKIVTSIKEIK